MNQAKTKFRYIYAGIMLAAVLAAAAGCGGEIFPKPQEDTSGMIGHNEGEMVRVRVTMPKSAALSVVPADVQSKVNFWEVVFKSADAKNPKYYYGTGIPAARNDIDVTVPIGNGYTVLLLGGDFKTKTLLAAGVPREKRDGPLVTKDILAGQPNEVVIYLDRVALQWNGSSAPPDAASAAALAAIDEAVKLAEDAVKAIEETKAGDATNSAKMAAGNAKTALVGDSDSSKTGATDALGTFAKTITGNAAACAAVQTAIQAAKDAAKAEEAAVESLGGNPPNLAEAVTNAKNALAKAREAVYAAYAAVGGDIVGDGDFTFSGTIGGNFVDSKSAPWVIVTNKKAVFFGGPGSEEKITADDTLTVTVNLSKMAVLQEVDINGKAAATPFFTVDPASYISLRERYDDNPDNDNDDKKPLTPRNISAAPGQPFTLPPGLLPQKENIDMALDVVLKYRAFGRAFDGALWNIANGFYPAADSSLEDGSAGVNDTVLNGGILIRFGSGS